MPTLIPGFTSDVKLDVACESLPIVVPTKQLDNLARTIKISMYDSRTDEVVEIPSSLTAEFHVTRPDGVLIEYSQPISIEDNVITVGLTESCLAVAGKALADLKLYEGDKIFSAASFALDIHKTATGTQSETRGILTKANLEVISEANYNNLASKESNTLYVITNGRSARIALGNIPISSGSSSATGAQIFDLYGTTTSTTGTAGGINTLNAMLLTVPEDAEDIEELTEENVEEEVEEINNER